MRQQELGPFRYWKKLFIVVALDDNQDLVGKLDPDSHYLLLPCDEALSLFESLVQQLGPV